MTRDMLHGKNFNLQFKGIKFLVHGFSFDFEAKTARFQFFSVDQPSYREYLSTLSKYKSIPFRIWELEDEGEDSLLQRLFLFLGLQFRLHLGLSTKPPVPDTPFELRGRLKVDSVILDDRQDLGAITVYASSLHSFRSRGDNGDWVARLPFDPSKVYDELLGMHDG